MREPSHILHSLDDAVVLCYGRASSPDLEAQEKGGMTMVKQGAVFVAAAAFGVAFAGCSACTDLAYGEDGELVVKAVELRATAEQARAHHAAEVEYAQRMYAQDGDSIRAKHREVLVEIEQWRSDEQRAIERERDALVHRTTDATRVIQDTRADIALIRADLRTALGKAASKDDAALLAAAAKEPALIETEETREAVAAQVQDADVALEVFRDALRSAEVTAAEVQTMLVRARHKREDTPRAQAQAYTLAHRGVLEAQRAVIAQYALVAAFIQELKRVQGEHAEVMAASRRSQQRVTRLNNIAQFADRLTTATQLLPQLEAEARRAKEQQPRALEEIGERLRRLAAEERAKIAAADAGRDHALREVAKTRVEELARIDHEFALVEQQARAAEAERMASIEPAAPAEEPVAVPAADVAPATASN